MGVDTFTPNSSIDCVCIELCVCPSIFKREYYWYSCYFNIFGMLNVKRIHKIELSKDRNQTNEKLLEEEITIKSDSREQEQTKPLRSGKK